MAVVPFFSYLDFQTTNQTLSDDRGPWTAFVTDTNSSRCFSDACGGACIRCTGFVDYRSDKFASLAANISLDMSEHKNATSISFAWSFWPALCGEGIATNYSTQVKSRIGDASFYHNISAVTCREGTSVVGEPGPEWTYSNRSTSISLSSDRVNAYIPITIDFLQPVESAGNFTYYLNWTDFKIQAFDTSEIDPESTTIIIILATIGSLVSVSLLLAAGYYCLCRPKKHTISPPSDSRKQRPSRLSRKGNAKSDLRFNRDNSTRTPTQVILGYEARPTGAREARIVSPGHLQWGSIDDGSSNLHEISPDGSPSSPKATFTSLHDNCAVRMPVLPNSMEPLPPPRTFSTRELPAHRIPGPPALSTPITPDANTPRVSAYLVPPANSTVLPARSRPPPPSISIPEAQPFSIPSPPAYSSPGNSVFLRLEPSSFPVEPSVLLSPDLPRDEGSSLADWARSNRFSVPMEMEAKLAKAGYVPGDDPSDLPEDEWKTKYGLTRLELLRLRKLHARGHWSGVYR